MAPVKKKKKKTLRKVKNEKKVTRALWTATPDPNPNSPPPAPTESKFQFDSLPLEVQFMILKNLDHETHMKARCICKHWLHTSNEIRKHSLTLTPGLVRTHALLDSPAPAQREIPKRIHDILSKLSMPEVDTLLIQNLNAVIPKATLALLPKSSQLILDRGNSKANLVYLLKSYCANGSTKSLVITREDPLAPLTPLVQADLSGLTLTSLSSLSIIVTCRAVSSSRSEHGHSLKKLLENVKFPSLISFSAHLDYSYNGVDLFSRTLEPALVQFITSNGAALKEFNFRASGLRTTNVGRIVLPLLEQVQNVERLTIECESDSAHFQEAQDFSEGVSNLICSMQKLTKLAMLLQTNYYGHDDDYNLRYVTEFNHATLRALGPQLTSLRYVEHSIHGLKSWLHAAQYSFPYLSSLNLVLDPIALNGEDAFEKLITCNGYKKLKTHKLLAVRTLTLQAGNLSQACVDWLRDFFPNLQDLVLDFSLTLIQIQLLLETINGSPKMPIRYITMLETDGDGYKNDPRIVPWCEEQVGMNYFRLKSAPSQIATAFYDRKNTQKYVCIHLA